MTLVFNEPVAGAGTHALVIGVNHYQYLRNGSNRPVLDKFAGLGQLESAAPSARLFASWLLERHHNPNAPLASVALLTSPGGSTSLPRGKTVDVDSATYDNVDNAVVDWFRRCDTHEDNVALFYIAGHGIWRETSLVLTEDFGRAQMNPFGQALDIGKLHQGMARCKASVQCFFVDACREFSNNTRGWNLIEGGVPIPTSVAAMQRSRDAPIIYATKPGKLANGDPSGVTLFVRALIATLNGLGAKRFGKREPWKVSTARLIDGANSWLRYAAMCLRAPHQTCHHGGDSGESVIQVIADEPEVVLTVSLHPESSALEGRLALSLVRGHATADMIEACNGAPKWGTCIPGGEYTLTVRCSRGALSPPNKDVVVMPPPEAFHEVEVA